MKITRRSMLAAGVLAGGKLLGGRWFGRGDSSAKAAGIAGIDRRALVQRHNPVIRKLDPFSALTVGNGNFAFTGDVTGLQTFAEAYRGDIPLCTCAHWAWHTTPAPPGVRPEDFRYKQYESHGRMVGYATERRGQEVLFDWLRENPHRMHLGRIGLVLKKPDGSEAAPVGCRRDQPDAGSLDGSDRQPIHIRPSNGAGADGVSSGIGRAGDSDRFGAAEFGEPGGADFVSVCHPRNGYGGLEFAG